jgi:delta 1-pyrroline-5-carboxylate dehydrogenase
MSNNVLITGTELVAGEGTPDRQTTDVTNDAVTLEQIAKLLERTLCLLIVLAARNSAKSSQNSEEPTE